MTFNFTKKVKLYNVLRIISEKKGDMKMYSQEKEEQLKKKADEIKAQLRAMQSQKKELERKQRTKSLIETGAILSSALGLSCLSAEQRNYLVETLKDENLLTHFRKRLHLNNSVPQVSVSEKENID